MIETQCNLDTMIEILFKVLSLGNPVKDKVLFQFTWIRLHVNYWVIGILYQPCKGESRSNTVLKLRSILLSPPGKGRFWSAFGLCSTLMLVKICNKSVWWPSALKTKKMRTVMLLFSFFGSYFLSLAIFHAKKSHVFGEIGAGIQQV